MKKAVSIPNAPKPIGPFSQAIVNGDLVFVSAQFARDPLTGQFVTDNIEAETKQVMENIKALLTEAGSNLANVVKASIFLKDMQDYVTVNSVYSSYFSEPYPAR